MKLQVSSEIVVCHRRYMYGFRHALVKPCTVLYRSVRLRTRIVSKLSATALLWSCCDFQWVLILERHRVLPHALLRS